MATKVETITTEQAYDRLLANLEDAEMGLWDFLTLVRDSCHLSCAIDWNDDRSIALEEAETYLFLAGGTMGVLKASDRLSPTAWGLTA